MKLLVGIILVCLSIGCINNNKQVELVKDANGLKLSNTLFQHVFDSIIATEKEVKDLAISLIINDSEPYQKLLYVNKVNRKIFLQEEKNNPQIVTTYKGIPVYVYIQSCSNLFYSFSNEKVKDELVIMHCKPIRLILKGDTLKYNNR